LKKPTTLLWAQSHFLLLKKAVFHHKIGCTVVDIIATHPSNHVLETTWFVIWGGMSADEKKSESCMVRGDWDTEDGAQNKRKAERGLCFLSLDRGEENLPPTLSAASVLLFL
jgi:hypothetical protein